MLGFFTLNFMTLELHSTLKAISTLIAMVAIIIILAGALIFVYEELPRGPVVTTTTSSTVSGPIETSHMYVISFSYNQTTIHAGQNQTIGLKITQGSSQVDAVPGSLQVNSPFQKNYQNFLFTTNASGAASFTFHIANNATTGRYVVIASIFSQGGGTVQNASSSFQVIASNVIVGSTP